MSSHRFFTVIASTFLILTLLPADLSAQQARQDFISMEQRIEQLIGILSDNADCKTADTAIRLGLETLYGGLRPLPSADLRAETIAADRRIAEAEQGFAAMLEEFVQGGRCPDQQALALDLKLFIEQMNEVAVAVGRITIGCGVDRPCPDLVPMLDEMTGHERRADLDRVLYPSFSAKLRSPFVPWASVYNWEEDVFPTKPIRPGECVAIVKETRGLMLKIHLERIDVVRDPWATALLARGTKIPIWALEWIPSQYVKTWSICNNVCPWWRRGCLAQGLQTTVTQKVKQDVPLTYFWRYFGAQPGKSKGGYH